MRISRQSGPRLLALVLMSVGMVPAALRGQTASSQPSGAPEAKTWYVQDPVTGQVFKQQLIAKQEKVAGWETVPTQKTVYVPTTTWQQTMVPSTQYVPQTTYQLQPKVRGVWNPFRSPTYAWESKPVTQWVPKQVSVPQVTPRTAFVPTQQTILEQRPRTRTVRREQLISTPVQRAPGQIQQGAFRKDASGLPTPSRVASNAWQPVSSSLAQSRPTDSGNRIPAAARTTSPTPVLRPIDPSLSRIAALPINAFAGRRHYAAPMQVASPPAGQSRDTIQTGMNATILR